MIPALNETQGTLYRLIKRKTQSHYSLYHEARAQGFKFTPSSVRTRVSELVKLGLVKPSGRFEVTPSGRKANLWKANR